MQYDRAHGHGAVRLSPERGPLADVSRPLRARRRRTAPGAVGGDDAGRAGAPRGRRGDGRARHRRRRPRPARLTPALAEEADVVVTMGCGDECPYIPGKRYVDWDLEDPKDRPIDEVRATRDDIAARVEELSRELDG